MDLIFSSLFANTLQPQQQSPIQSSLTVYRQCTGYTLSNACQLLFSHPLGCPPTIVFLLLVPFSCALGKNGNSVLFNPGSFVGGIQG